ncbi:PREDICTED: uncharacterized protein LOC109588562 [Amphimedon queenslandica]|uniref:Death domain-containing protein n=1 Tax=Amphimedon queenslandica TaxID=400682 RepID=A0AAN0JT24_AMPQE|nr:PREDICTED: uncharacterized protein LOC109588562 [Amphimedon queenslandica]|eukprot:XP_019860267.1 PREDICTED: uncharacterized protein LOC109588562 [Amphimedon queenslandica]
MKHEQTSTKMDDAPLLKNDFPNRSDKNQLKKLEQPTKKKSTENEAPENKPTENEQPTEDEQLENNLTEKEVIKNEPTRNELIKKKLAKVILKIGNAHANGNLNEFRTNWVYFIDSGGQPAYRELLPLFTRAAALNIITIDLTKGLDEKCEFQYRISQHTSLIHTDLKFSNHDIIQSTISSEAMLNSVKFPYVSDMPKHSHYLILGTRKELVTEAKLNEMNDSLINSSNLDLKNVIWNTKGSIIFPVNTLLPTGSKEREDASIKVCTAILNCRVEMKIKLPIRLFTFEIALQMEAKEKERSFLTTEEVIEIGKSCRLYDKSDIDKALRYLHNVTIILYYHDVLPNIIVVDPKPILDVLSCLIAITYVDHTDLHLVADPPPSPDEKNNLKKFGLFKEEIFKNIGKQIFIHDSFKSSHMITLLLHLHIIAKVENREEGDYFFPCALPSYDKLNPAPTEIQPLLIAWEIKNSGTTNLAIPQGLFPLTIVHLLEQKDIVDFSPVGKEYYKYHDAMSLRVYNDHFIHIINRYTHIEIHFRSDCKNSCLKIRELVTDAIKKSRKDLNVDTDHIFAFKCPQKDCYFIVQKNESSSWYSHCTHCETQCKVLESDDSYRCWFFSDSSSLGAEPSPSLEGPPSKIKSTELLDTSNLIDVLDALDDHKYSGVDYYDLGLRLGLHPCTLNVIKEDNKGDVRSCLRECLAAWLEQKDSVMRRGSPTYDTLIQALRKMGENAVADGIKRDT